MVRRGGADRAAVVTSNELKRARAAIFIILCSRKLSKAASSCNSQPYFSGRTGARLDVPLAGRNSVEPPRLTRLPRPTESRPTIERCGVSVNVMFGKKPYSPMETTIAAPQSSSSAETDFLPLQGTDYVEFWVGNAKQAAHYYKTAFGFQSLAYSGPETGVKERASYVIRQNKLTFVLSTPLRPNNPMADHIALHGDGVKFLSLKVEDATSAWKETTKRGAKSYMEPTTLQDENGRVVMSGIHTYGDTVHLFIERGDYNGVFMPGFRKWESNYNPPDTGLLYVDHCVGNVGWNQMNPWVKFYEDVMGFRNILTFDDKDISTEYSALMSKVMSNGNGFVKFPINEPAEGRPTLFFEIIQRKGAKSFGKGNFKALFEALEKEQEARGNL